MKEFCEKCNKWVELNDEDNCILCGGETMIDLTGENDKPLDNEIIIIAYLSEFLTKDVSSEGKLLNEINIMAERICRVFED